MKIIDLARTTPGLRLEFVLYQPLGGGRSGAIILIRGIAAGAGSARRMN
jgi:hypothetical protein